MRPKLFGGDNNMKCECWICRAHKLNMGQLPLTTVKWHKGYYYINIIYRGD